MICWDRQAKQTVGHFTPRQIRWFRDHVTAFRDEVSLDQDWRDLQRRLTEGVDKAEIAQQYDQRTPASFSLPTNVPAWSVLRPPMSPTFAEHMLADADLVLSSLPETGGVVVLPDARHVWAWVWSLYQSGMHLAFRLGLAWVPPHTKTSATADRAQRVYPKVMAWLMTVIDTLIDVADLPYPAIGTDLIGADAPLDDHRRQTRFGVK